MNTLSYTQEFFLCALNKNGNLPVLMTDQASACLIVGGAMELVQWGYLSRTEKGKLTPEKPWDGGLPYLTPLYERIAFAKKPRRINDIAINYSGKQFKAFASAIGESLVESGCAEKYSKKSLFGEKTKFVPNADAVKKVIEKIRAEFLEDGKMTNETICLAAMLDHSGLIRNYFSKIEAETMKQRLKEIRKSEVYTSIKQILDELTAIVIIAAASAAHS